MRSSSDARFTWRAIAAAAALLIIPAISWAGCHVVTKSGSGNSTGTDWNNACADFSGACSPSSLVRGDTYYVAAGSMYSPSNFDAPDSGTSVITVKAPSAGDHCSDAGWNGSLEGTAVFKGGVQFESDYWVFNGVHRDPGMRSGYGFKIENNNGSNAPYNMVALGAGLDSTHSPNHVTVKYVELAGSSDVSDTYFDRGIWFSTTGEQGEPGNYIGYSWIHDTGNCPILVDGQIGVMVEHNWIQNNQSQGSNNHSEGIAVRLSGTIPSTNAVIRYNYLENIMGTGFIATPSSNSASFDQKNFYIYGNTFFFNAADRNPRAAADQQVSNGIAISIFQTEVSGTLYVANNTFINVGNAAAGGSTGVGYSQPISVGTVEYFNNLWFKSNSVGDACLSGVVATCEENSNAAFQTPSNFADDPNVQVSGATILPNYASNDFTPAMDTDSGSNQSAVFSLDADGNAYGSDGGIWTRGAIQFMGTSSPQPPVPPTDISITIETTP